MSFPFIPIAPGVPPLPRDPFAILPTLVLLAADALGLTGILFGPPWGLFINGFPAIEANSVVSFDFKKDWTVSNYPLERGAFESYDKVEMPFDVRFRFASGGSEFERALLLQTIAIAADSLTLFDAVTPDAIYPSVNITHYDYKRVSTNGVGMIIIDVWCLQVRVSAVTAFSNTQSPTAANTVQGGIVQPQPMSSPGGGFF